MKIKQNKIYNLTTQEAYKLLTSKDMANWNCSIEFSKKNHGGDNRDGRKSGSKNKLTLKSLDSKINNMSKEFNGVKMTLAKLAVIVENGFKQINARIDKLDARIDNLVVKNNLKE